MISTVKSYFSEFAVLKTAGKDFWLTNAIQLFDGLAYFSMITIITLYLTTNVGFNDMDSGVWVGYYTLYVTAFVLAVGSICDTLGVKKSLYIGMGTLLLSRLSLGVAPLLFSGSTLRYVTMGSILVMSLGTAFMSPVTSTMLRRFTTKENRSTGFNIYYLIMNVGAMLAGVVVVDGFRGWLGEVNGNMAILDFGFAMSFLCMICAWLINENNYADPSERVTNTETKRPLAVFIEVWKEKPFQKLLLFLLLTLGVRLVFTHQFLVMPKYYTRVLFSDYDLGFANSINPFIIVVGLIVLIPIVNKYSTFKLIVLGMAISAFSLVVMALPLNWIMAIPGITSVDSAYRFIIFAQIIIFAFGELLFSPRFTEYISVVAPKEKIASYMSLSALPMFIAKPINGFLSGILVAGFSYEGIRAKIDSGNIGYKGSPEYMWAIYLALAAISPIAVIAMKNILTQKSPEPETESTTNAAEVC